MLFLSAGHYKKDPGAVANGVQENNLTIELRNLIVIELQKLGKIIERDFKIDNDNWDLRTYLANIHTGSGSVVFEIHFDSASSSTATGTTMIIPAREWTREFIIEQQFGKEIVDVCSTVLGIKNRGVIDETESHRGRLGLMRESGINGLLEVCFISNSNDLKAFNQYKQILAARIAPILIKYDNLKS